MNKATIISELIELHLIRGKEAVQLATEALGPIFLNLLTMCGEEDKAEGLVADFTNRLQPITLAAMRRVYDEMYSADELYALLLFVRANPWFLERATDQQRRISELAAIESQPVMEELFRPIKYKLIKTGILNEFGSDELTRSDLLKRLSDYSEVDVGACYDELVTEGKLTVEMFNGIPHARTNV